MKFLKKNSLFIALFLMAAAAVGTLLLQYDKITLHRQINSLVGNPTIDRFFDYMTYMGDGLCSIIVALVLALFNAKRGAVIVIAYAVSSLFVVAVKYSFFSDIDRPLFIFQYYLHEPLNLVDGVHVNIHNSFPSGHSTSVFCLFSLLAFMSRGQMVKLIFLFIAFLAAFSRTYLSQHWLVDVYTGSILGFLFAVAAYLGLYKTAILNKWDKPLKAVLSKQQPQPSPSQGQQHDEVV